MQAETTTNQDTIERNCFKCSRLLTDPASIQKGIGPICRKKANRLLAKEIDTTFDDKYLFAVLGIVASAFHPSQKAAVGAFSKLSTELLDKAAKSITGEDRRSYVDEAVRLLSWTVVPEQQSNLLNCIRMAGYYEVADLLTGKKAATLWLNEGDGSIMIKANKRKLRNIRGVYPAKIHNHHLATCKIRTERIDISTFVVQVGRLFPFTDMSFFEREEVQKMITAQIDCTY